MRKDASDALTAYRAARTRKGREAATGVVDPVAHYKPVEDALTTLNQGFGDYLLPRGDRPSQLVGEANRLMTYFTDSKLKIALHFTGLRFDRQRSASKVRRFYRK